MPIALSVVGIAALLILEQLAVHHTHHHHPHPIPTLVPIPFLHLFLTILAIISLLRAHLIPPGTPKHWSLHRPDLLYPPPPSKSPPISPSLSEQHPICTECNASKPPRTHHCRHCHLCILRFDHHCPALSACVGLHNHKFFLLFLFYTSLTALHAVVHFIHFLFAAYVRPPKKAPAILAVALTTPPALLVALAAAIYSIGLFVWSLLLAMRNETTVENLRFNSAANHDDKVTRPWIYPSVALANLRHVLGWQPLLWLLPVRQSRVPPLSRYNDRNMQVPTVSF